MEFFEIISASFYSVEICKKKSRMTPAFELILARYRLAGFETAEFKREKDKLVAFLNRVAGSPAREI
jgi:hypothetical protein